MDLTPFCKPKKTTNVQQSNEREVCQLNDPIKIIFLVNMFSISYKTSVKIHIYNTLLRVIILKNII